VKKTYKILLFIFIGVLLLFAVVFYANRTIKNKIKKGIEQELVNSNVEYEEILIDLINGGSVIKQPRINLGNTVISAKQIEVIDLDYQEYFSNKKIVFDRIVFKNPEIIIKRADSTNRDLGVSDSKTSKNKFKEDIQIKHVVIKDGILKMIESDSLKNGLFVSLNKMDIYDLHITKESLKEKIPFNYSEVSLKSDSLFYGLNAEHDLQIKNTQIKGENLSIKELKIIPKYSKGEFDRMQKVENDRFSLGVPNIEIKNFKWRFIGDKLELQSESTNIDSPVFNIYRNKLLPDNNSFKPLYSQKLREIGTKLKFENIEISNASITYEEKSVSGKSAGEINFSNMDADIANISNIGLGKDNFPKTTVSVKTDFMGASKLNFEMDFYINDPEDKFHFSGDLEGIAANEMNSFLKPALNIEVEGRISSMFFNFYGNNTSALGDTRLEYHDFKVEVLKKDGETKNKFLSTIANLIVKKNVANKKMDQKNISATRDQTKSFWNFLWLCIRNGALKSFI